MISNQRHRHQASHDGSPRSLEVGVGSLSEEGATKLLSGWAKNAVRQRELDLRVVELKGIGALAILGGYGGGADDLDGLESSAVSASHVVIHGINGIVERHVTVLSVHVMCSTSRVVFDPDSIVLDIRRLLLGNLLHV